VQRVQQTVPLLVPMHRLRESGKRRTSSRRLPSTSGCLSPKCLYRLLAPHIKQEEEGKFRCKECSKLFSARKFVEKPRTKSSRIRY
jgi:hypothetical protein